MDRASPHAAMASLPADWPNRAASRFLRAGGLRWHVQVAGEGPAILLLHGTGASTHSWRGLLPVLARQHTVIAPDLPGQGFSELPRVRLLSLDGMAEALAALLRELGPAPRLVVGHSAGAAIGARMVLDGAVAPERLVALNGALIPLGGLAGQLFAPLARLAVALPGIPRLVAWRAADRRVVERLLRDTGSQLDAEGVALYARLFRNPDHVAATLGMMAHWDLHALARDLPGLPVPLTLVVGQQDRTIRPTEARRIQARLAASRILALPGLGHLAHEEAPEEVACAILEEHP
ncbi:MAG: alpha/beta fold hydrolase [Acetobacteraceae bacterium]|nr:alpha/beta fold hydrolase [Acetobacteraceae bacterium]